MAEKAKSGVLLRAAQFCRAVVRLLLGLTLTLVLIWALLMLLWAWYPPVSTLMAARWVTFRPVERVWTPLARLSPHLIASVISSEDARFCRHNGIDWDALEFQLNKDGRRRGASTIAMQTAKNLFLWPQRSYLRKGLEIPLALAIDAFWSKRRIIEVYLNIAEWGDGGLFGAEAAAQHYFRKSARRLTRQQAALLTTALPNPRLRNPVRPGRNQRKIARIIVNRAKKAGPWLNCLRNSR